LSLADAVVSFDKWLHQVEAVGTGAFASFGSPKEAGAAGSCISLVLLQKNSKSTASYAA
jgi:hypothetical protein